MTMQRMPIKHVLFLGLVVLPALAGWHPGPRQIVQHSARQAVQDSPASQPATWPKAKKLQVYPSRLKLDSAVDRERLVVLAVMVAMAAGMVGYFARRGWIRLRVGKRRSQGRDEKGTES